jgi:hypothetical protein
MRFYRHILPRNRILPKTGYIIEELIGERQAIQLKTTPPYGHPSKGGE